MTAQAAQANFDLLATENDCTGVRAVSCDDGCWAAEVQWHGDWYPATFEGHYPDGAEIHWSVSA